MPQDLVFLIGNGAEAVLVESKGIGASQESAPARAFPFAVFLFQFPGFELAVMPTEILGCDAMQGGESGYAKARKNLGRDVVEISGPTAERARGFVFQIGVVVEKLGLGFADTIHDSAGGAVEHFPNCFVAVVANSLWQGGDFSKNVSGKIAAANFIEAASEDGAPIEEAAFAHEGRGNADAE